MVNGIGDGRGGGGNVRLRIIGLVRTNKKPLMLARCPPNPTNQSIGVGIVLAMQLSQNVECGWKS